MLHRLLLLPPLLLLWKAGWSQGFLPAAFQDVGLQDVSNIFREFSDLMAETQQDATGKEFGELENPQNFDQLPPNYHNEQKVEHPITNGTIYSHRKTLKVTDNKTGDMIFSQKTVSSIKQGYSSDAEPVKGCRNANDCEKEQYCQATVFTSKCRDCKAKDMVCSKDNECCLGYLCVWGRCAEVTRGESGTICDPQRGDCVAGLCCTHHKSLPFPVCALPPTEGEECKGPYGSLLRMIAWGAPGISAKGYCPCAEGLVCTNKGFNPFSTCEKSAEKSGFVDIEQAPFFQPIIRRDEELNDYDTDSWPWQLQDGQLAVVDLPQAAEDSENEAREAIKRLSEDMAGELEEAAVPLDRSSMEDAVGPSQSEFQELKQLANQMGQYFGPGFY